MANKIIHKHSSVITDGKAKLPSVEQLEYGELAVNYASGVETISIKNSDNQIVEFKSNNYVEGVIKELEQVVEDNSFITAASLNELNEKLKKLEESGGGSVDSSIIEEIDVIKKEIEDSEYVTATALTDLDDRLYLLGETIDENELVTAAALTQLNEKVKSLEDGNVSGLDEKLVAMEQMIENNSLVAAAALTNLDERTTDLHLRITDFDYKADLLDNRLTNVENGENSNFYTKSEIDERILELASEDYVNTKLDEVFQSVSNGKMLIASAITDKGIYASDDETFQELSDKIDLIKVAPPGTNIVGYVDEQNDIYISLSEIENGTYNLKYESNNGLLTEFDDIGTVEIN